MAAVILGDTFANDLLKLIFQGTTIANIAINATSSPATDLYLSLHTADPTSSGNQTTSEISFTGYARQALVRSSLGWTITANSVAPLADVVFGLMTAGAGGTASFAMIGLALSGTGKQLIRGAISPVIAVANGVNPKLTTSSAIVFGA